MADQARFVLIPEYRTHGSPEPYPGGIAPGWLSLNGVVALLREHKSDAKVIAFLADMIEE